MNWILSLSVANRIAFPILNNSKIADSCRFCDSMNGDMGCHNPWIPLKAHGFSQPTDFQKHSRLPLESCTPSRSLMEFSWGHLRRRFHPRKTSPRRNAGSGGWRDFPWLWQGRCFGGCWVKPACLRHVEAYADYDQLLLAIIVYQWFIALLLFPTTHALSWTSLTMLDHDQKW